MEPLPEVYQDGTCSLKGVRVVGALRGVPLLKFAADSGARAVKDILKEPDFQPGASDEALDLAILGGGVSGISAALEARRNGLSITVLEPSRAFSTIANFPVGKPIYAIPTDQDSQGLQITGKTKETLLIELEQQRQDVDIKTTPGRAERLERLNGLLVVHRQEGPPIKAQRVIVALGRSGDFRKLDVDGEHLPKVTNRLHDPREYTGQDLLIVGGGDSAVEAAIACAASGARVTLSYRGDLFTRPKPQNLTALESGEKAGAFKVLRSSTVTRIHQDEVLLHLSEGEKSIPNDSVLVLIGRNAPLDFFRRSQIPILGEWTRTRLASLIAFLALVSMLFSWKGSGVLNSLCREHGWFPYDAGTQALAQAAEPGTLAGILHTSFSEPGFFYSLAYCIVVAVCGFQRIQRGKTPYVKAQTLTLIAIQCLPLFLFPYVILPLLGANGTFDAGLGQSLADLFFPMNETALHGREYWRSFGFILAWPLFLWNVFTPEPLIGWLVVSVLQTFVLIPLMVHRWGKGAYCGWICSCGALAETLGDTHRHKMPHGDKWNRLNFLGQGILALVLGLLLLRVIGWMLPAEFSGPVETLFYGILSGFHLLGIPTNYAWMVDSLMAGILGVGLYFWFSGRTWCRFACPLAALMNIYGRFSRFRIFSEKEKCISCNACTTQCHQGIDVMSFANQGLPMEDPQCVRCSACVQACPTGVLTFGRLDRNDQPLLDRMESSPVRLSEPSDP